MERNPMGRSIIKITGLCLGIILLVWGIANVVRLTPDPAGSSDPGPVPENSVMSREAGWILGIWQGKLAVFPAGAAEPCQIYDVYVASLPPEEQERLSAGLVVPDDPTLASLLEDYTS